MKANILPLKNQQWIKSKWQIKLTEGDKIMESLQSLAERYSDWGFCEFRMIGAVKANTLKYAISESWTSNNPQTYNAKSPDQSLEILSCLGTISWTKEEKAKAHAHITLAESDGVGNAFGGHLIEAEVSIVAEIIVDVLTTGKNRLGAKNWDMLPIE